MAVHLKRVKVLKIFEKNSSTPNKFYSYKQYPRFCEIIRQQASQQVWYITGIDTTRLVLGYKFLKQKLNGITVYENLLTDKENCLSTAVHTISRALNVTLPYLLQK